MTDRNELLNVICRIMADGQAGALYLEKGEKKITAYFEAGLINAAVSNIESLRLGGFIARMARVDDSTLDRLLKEAPEKAPAAGKGSQASEADH